MAVETRSVSFYTCDSESCDYAVYREVDTDGLPAGYHGAFTQVDGESNAKGIDWFACIWDHVPSAMSGALAERGHAVENNEVPDHHTKGPDMPIGGGGLGGRRLDRMTDYQSSYDGQGGSEGLRLGEMSTGGSDDSGTPDLPIEDGAGAEGSGTGYSSGYSNG